MQLKTRPGKSANKLLNFGLPYPNTFRQDIRLGIVCWISAEKAFPMGIASNSVWNCLFIGVADCSSLLESRKNFLNLVYNYNKLDP